MRRGEVLGLRWQDLDFDGFPLVVEQTLVAPRYRLTFSEPKTKQGRRSIDLDPGTLAVLRAHRKRQAEEPLAVGAGYAESELVFRSQDGTPVIPHLLTLVFKKAVKEAGLSEIRLHDLRHTHVALLARAGVRRRSFRSGLGITAPGSRSITTAERSPRNTGTRPTSSRRWWASRQGDRCSSYADLTMLARPARAQLAASRSARGLVTALRLAIGSKVGSTPSMEDHVMSFVVRFNPANLTKEKYDDAIRRHEEAGIEMPPDGMDYHVCFGTDGDLRVSEIWESREQFDKYGERLMPLLAESGIEAAGEPEFFEVHNIIKR